LLHGALLTLLLRRLLLRRRRRLLLLLLLPVRRRTRPSSLVVRDSHRALLARRRETAQVGVVQLRNRTLRVLRLDHVHEPKPPRTVGLAVRHHLGLSHSSEALKHSAQIRLRATPFQPADEELPFGVLAALRRPSAELRRRGPPVAVPLLLALGLVQRRAARFAVRGRFVSVRSWLVSVRRRI